MLHADNVVSGFVECNDDLVKLGVDGGGVAIALYEYNTATERA